MKEKTKIIESIEFGLFATGFIFLVMAVLILPAYMAFRTMNPHWFWFYLVLIIAYFAKFNYDNY